MGAWSVDLGDGSLISTSSLDPVALLTNTWLIVGAGPELGKAEGGEVGLAATCFFGNLDLVRRFLSVFQKDP
jgi:hypothetical protein